MLSPDAGLANATNGVSNRTLHRTTTCIEAADIYSNPSNRIVSHVAHGRTHVPTVVPDFSHRSQGSWSQFSMASLPATSYQPRKGSLQRPYSWSSTYNVEDTRQEDSTSSPTAEPTSLSPDRTLAFQTATRASRQLSRPDIEMTRVASSERDHNATRRPPRPPLPHQNSRVRLLGASSARIDIEPHSQYLRPLEDHWPSKRAPRGLRNRVKLVWVYSFILTVFVLTAGLYPLGIQFYRIPGSSRLFSGLGFSIQDGRGDTTLDIRGRSSLDAVLRCRMDSSTASSAQANSGANAISGLTHAQGSTDASLSNDIWGWKRHKGIVYANSHNDEMHGDRAFVSRRFHRSRSND